MEMKLEQELAIVYHDPLFLVFLDLRKACDNVDRGRLIQTLEGYSAGPCLCGLLETFWAHQKLVPRKNGYPGMAFQVTRVKKQGVLVSLTLFNIVVIFFIRTCLDMKVEDQRVAHNRMVEAAGSFLGVFYADESMVGSRYYEWLHHLMNVLVGLFRGYGLTSNVTKSRTMTCQTGALRSGMS